MLAATAEYRNDQDVIGRFIDDCCDVAPELHADAKELNTRLAYWTAENGIDPINATNLGIKLADLDSPRVGTRRSDGGTASRCGRVTGDTW